MEDRKPRIDLKDAEVILQQAKTHLDKGETLKAMQTASKADKTVDRTTEQFKGAISAVENARRVIEDAKRAGVKTEGAEEALSKANAALILGKYSEVKPFARQCYTILQSASFVPGRDMSVSTKVEYDQGKTKLTVSIENNTDYTIRTLKVKPDLKDTPFLQEGERSLSLKPNKEEKLVYELTSTALPGSTGQGREFILGKEITLEVTLRPITRENRIIYAVWVTNNTTEALLNLRIAPKLPDKLTPDAPEKFIDELLPGQKKQVVFELRIV